MRRQEYMALPTARMAFAFGPGTPDNEAGKRIKAIVRAVVEGETGVDPLADAALANEEAYREQRTEAAKNRWGNHKPPRTATDAPHGGVDAPHGGVDAPHEAGDAPHEKTMHIPTNRQTDIPTNRHTTPTDRPTDTPTRAQDAPGSGVGDVPSLVGVGSRAREGADPAATFRQPPPSDPHAELGAQPDETLPTYAVAVCHEADPLRALEEYKRAMAEMGPERFRILLDAFLGDCRESEPKKRGAAFMARVMEELKTRREERRLNNALRPH